MTTTAAVAPISLHRVSVFARWWTTRLASWRDWLRAAAMPGPGRAGAVGGCACGSLGGESGGGEVDTAAADSPDVASWTTDSQSGVAPGARGLVSSDWATLINRSREESVLCRTSAVF